jgi:hypothetical protein
MCRAQCLPTSRQKQLGRPSSGRTRSRLKLIKIEPKEFGSRLKTRIRKQTGHRHATSLDKGGSRNF